MREESALSFSTRQLEGLQALNDMTPCTFPVPDTQQILSGNAQRQIHQQGAFKLFHKRYAQAPATTLSIDPTLRMEGRLGGRGEGLELLAWININIACPSLQCGVPA